MTRMRVETESIVAEKVARLRAKVEAAGVDVETILVSDPEHVTVEYEFEQWEDGVNLVRRVWNKAYRRTDQYVLFEVMVAHWDSYAAGKAMADFIFQYGSACEWEGAHAE